VAEFTDSRKWGAELLSDGSARFRIWAPDLGAMSVAFDDKTLPMDRNGEGWFELTVPSVSPGTRYGFALPDGLVVPDPASRAQDGDVHARSLVVDRSGYRWRNECWRGRQWRDAVICEIHIGTFTPQGTFRAAAERLEHISSTGITCVELMPIGQFSGSRGWGYDGVLPYAPHSSYGTPDDLKNFVDTAHGLGLMVLLDAVYNHFGPDGNYLPLYAGPFFDETRNTPWGAGIAYDREPVRRFFIDNALYWVEEFRFDGFRLDAVDQIKDASVPELLIEIAQTVRERFLDRHIHLTTEDNRNIVGLHRRENGRSALYTGEWNDDFHNAVHALLTGEVEGYYQDFAQDSLGNFVRCLAEGFAFQGEPSHHAGGELRGEPSVVLPPTAFVDFLQNHDQIGNRAFGERLTTLVSEEKIEALTAILLLSPHIPLIFMGEEWGETRPFCFFTDYSGDLGEAVRNGRRREFAHFSAFRAGQADTAQIPDPNDERTFTASILNWQGIETENGAHRLALFKKLLKLRAEHIVPLLSEHLTDCGRVVRRGGNAIAVEWGLAGACLQLRANLGDEHASVLGVEGRIVYANVEEVGAGAEVLELRPWSVVVAIQS
jgi:maltooligosyltrehalose trehalohydrolase